MFSRYADLRNLEVAIPMREASRFSWPQPFGAEEVDVSRLRKEKANVLVHHATYRFKSEFENVMLPGCKYITILRNPVERFESQFFYDKFDRLFSRNLINNTLLSFLKAMESGSKLNMTYEQKDIALLFTNGMLFDLTGEKLDAKTPQEDIHVLIREIENDFDFVLIMEHFDEGLLLLRKMFSWTFLDIVYKKQHVRRIKHRHLLTEEVIKRITEINQGDIKLYDHFRRIFEKRLNAYGNSLQRHLDIFRQLNKEINKQCADEYSIVVKEKIEAILEEMALTNDEYKMVGDFSVITRCFCTQLYRNEVSYIQYFRRKFRPYYFVTNKAFPKAFCD